MSMMFIILHTKKREPLCKKGESSNLEHVELDSANNSN